MTTLALMLLAAAPQAQVELFFQGTLSDSAYQQQVFAAVAKRWATPAAKDAPSVGAKTVVQVVIDRAGKVVTAVVSTSSGSKKWDDAAVAMVKRATFPPLPKSLADGSLELHVHVRRAQ